MPDIELVKRAFPGLRRTKYSNVDDVSTQKPRTYGLRSLLRREHMMPLAFFAGIVCVVSTIVFTSWLSRKTFSCPQWSTDCTVDDRMAWIRGHLGTVQGIVTAIYALGLAGVSYVPHALAEVAIWPLLCRRKYSIKQIDVNLAASRGSIAALFSALSTAKNIDSIIVLVCVAIIILTPFTSGPLVGYVYDLEELQSSFQSTCVRGGGMGFGFSQKTPPTIMPGAVGNAFSTYTSWASNLSSEPLPQYRDWFIDRDQLAVRGVFSAPAVRIQRSIDCQGFAIKLASTDSFEVETNMGNPQSTSEKRSDPTVMLRNAPPLTVWVHDFIFNSPSRTTATVVFASINGTIEDGLPNKLPQTNASAVACDVGVELFDDRLITGSNAPVTDDPISSIADIQKTHSLNEVNLWLAVAPALSGITIDGTQPTFAGNHWMPQAFTTSAQKISESWTIAEIKNFVDVTMGSLAITTARAWPKANVTLTSIADTTRMNPARPPLLLIPLFAILAATIVLTIWNVQTHRRLRVPVMRLGKLEEILKSAQTSYVREQAEADARQFSYPSQLDKLELQFGLSEDNIVGLDKRVKPFSSIDARELVDVPREEPEGSLVDTTEDPRYIITTTLK
ncbi:MAG: hypothetical protein M1820_000517 [Bogoriella megaspora]|nr:MAG: hypothetical protein M1820_000517 [Bogoriella megaspora]